jgi:Ubiquitin interaction motif.
LTCGALTYKLMIAGTLWCISYEFYLYEVDCASELETARPQTVGEEELQLQLALAMSREEAEQEEQRRRSDDVRLQLALSQSEEEFQ